MLFILLLGKVLSCHAYVKHEDTKQNAMGQRKMEAWEETTGSNKMKKFEGIYVILQIKTYKNK